MGAVYKPTYTKPLPDGAELFTRNGERFARWTDGRGRKRTAKVTVPKRGKHAGKMRVVRECGTYTAKYRNGANQVSVQLAKGGAATRLSGVEVLAQYQ